MKFEKLVTGIVMTNTYIIANDDNECIIIDPGEERNKIFKLLEENKWTCKYVLLTHAHHDHCNSCAALKNAGAKIYMHKKDLVLVKTDYNLASKFGIYFNYFIPDNFVKDGEKLNLLGFDISVLHTPGHTAGSCCYIIDNFLFTGDTLMRLTTGRTDFPTGNKKDMNKSIKKLFNIEKDYMVFSGHGGPTNLFFERDNNPYV